MLVAQLLEMYALVEYLMAAMKEHDEFASTLMARPMVKVDAKNFEKLLGGREEDKADVPVGHYL